MLQFGAYLTIVFYDRKTFIVQATGSTVAEHSTYYLKSEGPNLGIYMLLVSYNLNIL
jgi:hypothetical protein